MRRTRNLLLLLTPLILVGITVITTESLLKKGVNKRLKIARLRTTFRSTERGEAKNLAAEEGIFTILFTLLKNLFSTGVNWVKTV